MANAKLSHSAAASLAFVRNLQNEETHQLVRREVFAQVKAAFGIPEAHRIKVELDASRPNYLEIIRKKDGAKYELGNDNRWVGDGTEKAVPAVIERPMYVKLPVARLKDLALEEADAGDADVFEPRDIGYATAPVRISVDDANHIWVKVDGNDLDGGN